MDRLVMSIATGTGIAWGGKEALDAWQRAREGTGSEGPAARQKATLGRLAAWYPGAVISKRPD